MLRRSVIASLTLGSALALVVACAGGPGPLGAFGDDGVEGQQGQQPGSSGETVTPSRPPSNGSTTSSGGSSSSSGGSTSSSGGSTSSSGQTVDTGAPFACGSTLCQASQYCVEPCCGGAQPQCYALDSGTTCPPGYSYGYCATAGDNGCLPDPCTPPPSYCVSSPSSAPGGCSLESATSRTLVCSCS